MHIHLFYLQQKHKKRSLAQCYRLYQIYTRVRERSYRQYEHFGRVFYDSNSENSKRQHNRLSCGITAKLQQQECIRVGCVLTAAVATTRCQYWEGCMMSLTVWSHVLSMRGVSLFRGGGLSTSGGVVYASEEVWLKGVCFTVASATSFAFHFAVLL